MLEINDPKLQFAFDQYCIWKSIPKHFHSLTEDSAELSSLDPSVLELVKIHSKMAFCEKYGVTMSALNGWTSHPEYETRVKKSWKSWARGLTPDVIHKLYQKIMDEGDAARVKVWGSMIEDQVENTVNIDLGITRVREAMVEDNNNNEKQTRTIQHTDNRNNKASI